MRELSIAIDYLHSGGGRVHRKGTWELFYSLFSRMIAVLLLIDMFVLGIYAFVRLMELYTNLCVLNSYKSTPVKSYSKYTDDCLCKDELI